MRDERGAVLEILLEIVESQFIDGVIIKTRRISQQQGGEIQAVTVKEIEKKKQNSGQGQTVTVRETY